MQKKPVCKKCGKPAAYYGPVGGYSVACEECNSKNALRQRKARAASKNNGSAGVDQVVPAAQGAAIFKPKPTEAKLPGYKMPGNAYNRTLVATEPDDAGIARLFKAEPQSLWVVTPTRIVERKAFMAAQQFKK